jgi:nitrogen fixation protein FixH
MSIDRNAPDTPLSSKPLTGRKVLLIALAAFGVVIAANMALLFSATGSFSGLVVKNSYIASQGWDRKATAQQALGWTALAEYRNGALLVTMTGQDGSPVTGLNVVAIAGRPASDRDDVRLELVEKAQGYTASLTLAPGGWQVVITGADSGGNSFEAIARLHVQNPG